MNPKRPCESVPGNAPAVTGQSLERGRLERSLPDTLLAGPFRRACCLYLARPSRDDRRCHRDLVILAPGRPDGPPQLEEVGIEVLDAQRLARCIKHLLRLVPVDGPTARLGRGG